ncbi:MAG: hypothetical protein A2V98_08475 [Planctomycetes bacterium RBG_16_64_12]|nr:MAG: hypothetical protein A2V98_08475 [Planctomycetes bacterium RBG_16_64_12]
MNSMWFNVAVVLLWVATMSWLISQKVVPSLLVGEPPSYRTIVEAKQEEPLVGWSMTWNDRRVGWALDTTRPLANGMTEVRSLVHFDDLPLEEMTPGWLRSMLLPDGGADLRLEIEAKSKLTFDPLQRPSEFESSVGFQGMDDVIKVRGTLDGAQLKLSVHAGDITYDRELDLPREALLNDALSPQSKLPGLTRGQTWKVEIYSPLRPPHNPMEVLQATVEGTEPVVWGRRVVDAWLVVYRADPGAGTANARSSRGRLWVRRDGTVLKQEVTVFDSAMTFVRLSDGDAAALAEAAGDWE